MPTRFTLKVWNCERRRSMPAGKSGGAVVVEEVGVPGEIGRTPGLRSRYHTERELSGLSMSNTMRRRTPVSMRTGLRKRCEVCERSPVLSTRVPFNVCAWNWSLMKKRLKRASVEVTVALFQSFSSAGPSGRLKSSKCVIDARNASTRVASPPSNVTSVGRLVISPSASMRCTRT